ncbi:uncharacterized protein B0T23DRAFT_314621 [Neurospora hispaniola]|uniref:Uncharacterized protein n=1 Tax=Neurospora hispaniola TaxID=588809 RepID=A0AAJ0I9C7_9PEZI|nr:hypothetical protein B0T23DRAFT_314621 [Neurospora hispaniola]
MARGMIISATSRRKELTHLSIPAWLGWRLHHLLPDSDPVRVMVKVATRASLAGFVVDEPSAGRLGSFSV